MMASKEESWLEEDQEIPGQRFVLLSFLSPENVLEKKELYFFNKFVDQYEINWKTKNLEKFLAESVNGINKKLDAEADRLASLDLSGASEICRSSRINVSSVLEDYQTFIQKEQKEIKLTKIKEDYDSFMYMNSKKLEDEFFAKNNFQTSVRGLKIRGTYSTQEEAVARTKKLQKNDPIHNIYVGEVGKWLPWDPKPHEVSNQEYANEELNSLMKAYNKNEEDKAEYFNTMKKQTLEAANVRSTVVADEKPLFGASEEHGALFEGPADLAIQRKMEREASASSSSSSA